MPEYRTARRQLIEGERVLERVDAQERVRPRESREFHHVSGHFGARVMKLDVRASTAESKNPSPAGGSRKWSYAMRLLEEAPERAGYLLKERVSDVAVLADALRRIGEGE